MKSVVICVSRRYKKEIREFAGKLEKAGIDEIIKTPEDLIQKLK